MGCGIFQWKEREREREANRYIYKAWRHACFLLFLLPDNVIENIVTYSGRCTIVVAQLSIYLSFPLSFGIKWQMRETESEKKELIEIPRERENEQKNVVQRKTTMYKVHVCWKRLYNSDEVAKDT